jgi:hypothetical protein
MYVSMRRKTASVTSRARTTLSASVVVEHTGHVRVCSMVTGGECLISAWNLCSISVLLRSPTIDLTSVYVKLNGVAARARGPHLTVISR